jgi:hypothetical protein
MGDWGLGIGDWAQSPIPNPQSPIPNPQSPIPMLINNLFHTIIFINNIILNMKNILKLLNFLYNYKLRMES